MKLIENFYDICKNNIFITGWDYVDKINSKEEIEKKWYEKLYVWYYNNCFNIILIVGLVFIIYLCINEFSFPNFYKEKNNITKKQKGGANENGGNSKESSNTNSKSNENSSNNNSTGNNAKVKNLNNNFKQLNTEAEIEAEKMLEAKEKKFDLKKGFSQGKDLGGEKYAEKRRRLKMGIDRAKKRFKENLGPFYKFLFSIFIFIAFGMFIMPTIVMFIISYITFYFTRHQVQKVLTK